MDPRRQERRFVDQDMVVSGRNEGDDFISNLPNELKSNIVSLLSTRDAVRAGVLSSRWQGISDTMEKISVREAEFANLKEAFMPISTRDKKEKIRTTFVKFVTCILSKHRGTIREFEIETEDYSRLFSTFFDRWFNLLSERDELRKISFLLRTPTLYELPPSLFSSHGFPGLNNLKLRSCHITLPAEFEGFRSVSVLELIGCFIGDQDVEKLVSSCPSLEEFVMDYGYGTYHQNYPIILKDLKLDAPNLKKLSICGSFGSLQLKTPCLLTARLELSVLDGIKDSPNLAQALFSMPALEVLGVHRFLLTQIASCPLPKDPVTITKLRMLALDVNLAEEESVIRLLLESAPSLEELKLKTTRSWRLNNSGAALWKVRNDKDILFNLRVVQLHSFSMQEPEYAFLKYLLNCTPFLRELSIVTDNLRSAKEKAAILEVLQKDAASMNLHIKINNCINFQ